MTTTHPSTPTPVPTTKAPADRDGAGTPHARPTQPEARSAVPMSVQAAAAWSWRIIMIAAALALLLWVIGYFKVLVVSVAIAVLLTVLLAPFVRFLQRRARFSRGIASGTAVLGLLALVSGLLTLAGRSIVNGFAELSNQAQEGFRELARWLSAGPLDLSTDQIDQYIDQAQAQVSDNASSLVSGALSVGTTLGHVVAGARGTAEEVGTGQHPRGPASLAEHLPLLRRLVASRAAARTGDGGLPAVVEAVDRLVAAGAGERG